MRTSYAPDNDKMASVESFQAIYSPALKPELVKGIPRLGRVKPSVRIISLLMITLTMCTALPNPCIQNDRNLVILLQIETDDALLLTELYLQYDTVNRTGSDLIFKKAGETFRFCPGFYLNLELEESEKIDYFIYTDDKTLASTWMQVHGSGQNLLRTKTPVGCYSVGFNGLLDPSQAGLSTWTMGDPFSLGDCVLWQNQACQNTNGYTKPPESCGTSSTCVASCSVEDKCNPIPVLQALSGYDRDYVMSTEICGTTKTSTTTATIAVTTKTTTTTNVVNTNTTESSETSEATNYSGDYTTDYNENATTTVVLNSTSNNAERDRILTLVLSITSMAVAVVGAIISMVNIFLTIRNLN